MSTQNQTLTNTWVDVKTTLSLTDSQKYTFQNTGQQGIRIFEASAAPDDDVYGHYLDTSGLLSVTPASGLNIYVRSVPKNLKSNLTVTEAV